MTLNDQTVDQWFAYDARVLIRVPHPGQETQVAEMLAQVDGVRHVELDDGGQRFQNRPALATIAVLAACITLLTTAAVGAGLSDGGLQQAGWSWNADRSAA